MLVTMDIIEKNNIFLCQKLVSKGRAKVGSNFRLAAREQREAHTRGFIVLIEMFWVERGISFGVLGGRVCGLNHESDALLRKRLETWMIKVHDTKRLCH